MTDGNLNSETRYLASEEPAKRDLSISMVQANVYGLLFFFPVALLAAIYWLIWGDLSFGLVDLAFSSDGDGASLTVDLAAILGFVVVIVAGIVVHELLHALSWVYLGRKSWSAIKFGVVWKALAPYAHCKEAVEVRRYRWAVAMPGILLGLVPSLIGILTGVGPVMLFGLIFTLAAAGDALILWVIRSVEAGKLVEDHPSRAGCYVIEN